MDDLTREKIKALLLAAPSDHFEKLEGVLNRLGIKMVRAFRLAEAERFLVRTNTPWLIFTDTVLPDGDWKTVLGLAAKAPIPARVIVVSRFMDLNLYLESLDRGAEDFVMAPFTADEVAHVVRGAVLHESIAPQRETHAAVA